MNKPKLLIVEDEIESQKYLQLILRKHYDIDICDTKDSMLSLLVKNEYDTIIMDISLKNGFTGIDLISELKRHSVYKNIPIVCLSAHAYGETRRQAERLGADVYLTKPVSNKVLIETLEKLIIHTNYEGKET